MAALLATYTDADAASAIDDARECVRTAIVDPKSFCFDHLLRLSAVKLLQKASFVSFHSLFLFDEFFWESKAKPIFVERIIFHPKRKNALLEWRKEVVGQ